ncbi:MAG: Ig-like domain-containing protein [Hungatella sp.]|nr:Ig-like domain-containing protein [Hungatella sp.]
MNKNKFKSLLTACLAFILMMTWPSVFAFANVATTVNSEAEFKKALKDDSISKIVLGKDIEIKSKISVSRKNDLTIDGGTKHFKLIEASSLASGSATSYILTFKGSFKNLTFSNLGMLGGSYGASVYVPVSGARVTFDHVDYRGPALYYSVSDNNTGVIKDSTIILDTNATGGNGATYTSEVMHAFNVELAGKVNITKNKTGGNDHDEIFYLGESKGDLIVAENAQVNIENLSTAGNSSYWSGLAFLDSSSNQHHFIINKGASFTYKGFGGCVIEEWPLAEFSIGEGAVVNISLSVPKGKTKFSDDNGSYFRAKKITVGKNAIWNYTLNGDTAYKNESMLGAEELTVEEGAALRVIAPGNKTAEKLVVFFGKDSSMKLNNPDDVLFYNGAKTPPASALASAASGDAYGTTAGGPIWLSFTGKGISTWNSMYAPIVLKENWTPDTDKPVSTWGTIEGENFAYRASIGSNGAVSGTILEGGQYFPNKESNPAYGLTSLNSSSIVRFNGTFSMGFSRKPVINVVYEKDKRVTGTGIPGSEITLTFPDDIVVEGIIVNEEGKWLVAVPETVNLRYNRKLNATQKEPDKTISKEYTETVRKRGLKTSVIKSWRNKNGKSFSVPYDIIQFTVIVKNDTLSTGPWKQVVAVEELHEDLSFVKDSVQIDGEAAEEGMEVNQYQYNRESHTLTINLGTLDPGKGKNIIFCAQIKDSVPDESEINGIVQVTGNQ